MIKASWEEIPSIGCLEIDWEYEPQNPLGKRSLERLSKKPLLRMLEVDHVPVKIISQRSGEKGLLVDISHKGLAVLLDIELKEGVLVKSGFFLGGHKIISRGIIRNISLLEGKYRVGIEFINLSKENIEFINSLSVSKVYGS